MLSVLTLLIGFAFASDDMNSDPSTLPVIPEQVAKWDYTPTVIVCGNSIVTVEQVKDSFALFGVDVKPRKMIKCDCEGHATQIRFTAPECSSEWGGDINNHGYTRITFIDDSIVSVSVSVNTSDDPIVLTHEIGHSLGWLHSSMPGHLMYPSYHPANVLLLGMENAR